MSLHRALSTKVVEETQNSLMRLALVKLQDSKEDARYSLHARPTSFTLSGTQTSDYLALLGFSPGDCTFLQAECHARSVDESFDLSAFSKAFPEAIQELKAAERHLEKCGLILPLSEGLGYLKGARSQQHQSSLWSSNGNGHTSQQTKQLKVTEDSSFTYIMTWIVDADKKGWTTHYRPKHPPLSPEVATVFDWLGIAEFPDCPEFDFEPCRYLHIPARKMGQTSFDNNADIAHQYFDANAEEFSPGIQHLLTSQVMMQPFGMNLFPLPRVKTLDRADPKSRSVTVRPPVAQAASSGEEVDHNRSGFKYDVALSFAGMERALAERLAILIREAGFEVFYDDFYPEHLWGKELPVVFDEVYRKESRYCVIIASNAYTESMWTNHERQSAVARALQEKGKEYILQIRVDDVDLPGIPPTIGYIALGDSRSIEDIADVLIRKLRSQDSK